MTLTPREIDEKRRALRAATRRKYRWSGFDLLLIKKPARPKTGSMPDRYGKTLPEVGDMLNPGPQR